MRDSLRHFVSEFVGTFALVFVGSGAILLSKMPNSGVGLLEIAVAHGIILSVMVSALMRISGHFNTAVTVGFLAARRIAPMMAGIYIVAQLLGAMVAAYALKGLFPHDIYLAARGGGQFVSLDISTTQAIVLEIIGTFFLVFVIFGTAVDPHGPKVGGFAIGLTIAADILAFGPFTGASMNPARSFGPAVASGMFEGHLIYWIGPIIGGLIAALLYDSLFLRRGIEPIDHGPIEAGR
jgi:MIP family channel proteins